MQNRVSIGLTKKSIKFGVFAHVLNIKGNLVGFNDKGETVNYPKHRGGKVLFPPTFIYELYFIYFYIFMVYTFN